MGTHMLCTEFMGIGGMLEREGKEVKIGQWVKELNEQLSRTEMTSNSEEYKRPCGRSIQRCEESLKFRFSENLGKHHLRIMQQAWLG